MKQYGSYATIRWLKIACASFVLIAVGIIMGSSVQAAAPKTALSISPPLFELSANPGDTLKQAIRVENLTDQPLPVTLNKKDFVALGEEGQAALTDKPSSYSLASWVKLDETKFTLAPKGSKTVAVRIAVPENAEPGGHFGSVVFHTQTKSAQNGSGVAVGQEIGALLLLKVAGTVNEKASIASFTATQDIWESAPVQFEARFKNEGNVQVKPNGTLTISDMFGNKVGTTGLSSRTVLPESIRKIPISWNEGAWPGWYTATVSIGYGGKGQLLTATTNFIIFPYKILLPIIIGLAVLGFLIFRARKRLWRSLRILFGKE